METSSGISVKVRIVVETMLCHACMEEIPKDSLKCPKCGQPTKASRELADQWVRDRAEEYSVTGLVDEKDKLSHILSSHPLHSWGRYHDLSSSIFIEEYEELLAVFCGLMENSEWLVGLTTKRLIFVHIDGHSVKAIALDKIKRVEHDVYGQFALVNLSQKNNAKTITNMSPDVASKVAALIGERIGGTNKEAPPKRRVPKRPTKATVSLPDPTMQFHDFDDPLPTLKFSGESFILTGTSVLGERNRIAYLLNLLGAKVSRTPSKSGCIVVVGDLRGASNSNKILVARELRDEGYQVSIIPDAYFADSLNALGIAEHNPEPD